METTETTTTNAEMAEKLQNASEKAEKQKTERRERVVKGSHLLPKLKEMAAALGPDATKENSGFLKVNAGVKSKNVLIAKKGGRVDLSGFSIENPAVKQLTETEAREKHLGKVRGQIDFNKTDDEVIAAFAAALAELAVAPPPPPPKAPKADPAPAPAPEAAPAAPAETPAAS